MSPRLKHTIREADVTAPMERYTAHDRERMLPEEHSSRRSDFARDRARLLHSSALRRLAQKTQVLSPNSGFDFARNRLTHSLEVAQVGRELADALGASPDVVDTACLAHDIGHPPFGHNGERALNDWAAEIGGFEGNAQTLRVLTRLEPKVIGDDGRSFGLNLTRASLDASCKYPWPEAHAAIDPSGRRKFGFYDSDAEVFDWLRSGAPEGERCVEAEIMDLSDDIAYSVHDFEDAVTTGYIDLGALESDFDSTDLRARMSAWAGEGFDRAELDTAYERLTHSPHWLHDYRGSRADGAHLKNLTSHLIGRFAKACTSATIAAANGRAIARFGTSVVVPREIACEIAALKGIVAAYVMSSDDRQPLYADQRALLTELANEYLSRGERVLAVDFAADWRAARSDAERARVVVDQVASLTDQSAVAAHRALVG